MYKRIKNFFTVNLHWKVFSLLMSTLLWFVVMNINNPTEIKTFSLNINFLNEDKLLESNITVLNLEELKAQKAEIKIRATRPTLDELSKKANKENIQLIVDLSQFSSYTIENEPISVLVSLKPDVPTLDYPNNTFELLSFSPLNVTLLLDKVVTVSKKIDVETTGKIKSGYIVGEPELSSEYINVTGAQSILKTIQNIVVNIDISDKDKVIQTNIEPIAYNADGEVVKDISYDIETVNVKLPVYLESTINISEPTLIGSLPEGYILKDISYTPTTVEVIGNAEDISKIGDIKLPDIDVTGMVTFQDITFSIFDILAKNNITLKNKIDGIITVSITIEKAQSREIQIPMSNITVNGNKENNNILVELPQEVSIKVYGEDKIIDVLNINDIKGSVDISDLGIGEHSVSVSIELPEGVSFLSEPNINVVISDNTSIEIAEDTTTFKDSEDIDESNLSEDTFQAIDDNNLTQ